MKSSYRGRYKLSATSKDFVGMCSFALTYNGKPESKRIWQHSPYVFSGTNINKKENIQMIVDMIPTWLINR